MMSPLRVMLKTTSTGSRPLTLTVRLTFFKSTHCPSARYWSLLSGLSFSIKKSASSAMTLVNPQPWWGVWPIRGRGMPGIKTPVTLRSLARMVPSHQMGGWEKPRWGSLQRIGLPVADLAPETTQELEPGASPAPRNALALRPRARRSDTARAEYPPSGMMVG